MKLAIEMNNQKNAKERPRNDEVIDYSIRPAKNIERKMICEALSRLSIMATLRDYQYVGFGSTYFVDFSLFHKILGIQKLISIEGDDTAENRVKFNSPYSCIEILMGMSTDKLPEISWEKQRSILWLDYTSSLSGYMFSDMATFFNRAVSGSVFLISVNVEVKDEQGGKTTDERIKSKLNKDSEIKNRIRRNTFERDLKKEDYYELIRNVVQQEVEIILDSRNRIETKSKFKYKQIFNFLYHDGQAMLTIGGVLYSEAEEQKIISMNFNNLEFVMESGKSFEITVPHLTSREIQVIDKFLPDFHSDPDIKEKAFSALKGIVSESAIEKYANVYRYFPAFKEIAI
jgi:uncharacterized membrane protein